MHRSTDLQQQQEKQSKALQFLTMVEKKCRLAGGKYTLSPDEYLEIVNACYREVYGTARPENAEDIAHTSG